MDASLTDFCAKSSGEFRNRRADEGNKKKLSTNKSVLHFLSHNLNVKFTLRCKNVTLEREGGEGRGERGREREANSANLLYIFQLRRYIEFKRIPQFSHTLDTHFIKNQRLADQTCFSFFLFLFFFAQLYTLKLVEREFYVATLPG